MPCISEVFQVYQLNSLLRLPQQHNTNVDVGAHQINTLDSFIFLVQSYENFVLLVQNLEGIVVFRPCCYDAALLSVLNSNKSTLDATLVPITHSSHVECAEVSASFFLTHPEGHIVFLRSKVVFPDGLSELGLPVLAIGGPLPFPLYRVEG